jgi:hypothetical protein
VAAVMSASAMEARAAKALTASSSLPTRRNERPDPSPIP